MQEPPKLSGKLNPTIDRRTVLRGGAGIAAAVSGASFLAACGSSSTSSSGTSAGTTAAAGTPKKGGTLTVGLVTGGQAETVNPGIAVNTPDILRVYQIFDNLYQIAEDGSMKPLLVEHGQANAAGDVWTFELRDGVTFHDGKPFTADDVVYTISTWSEPTNYANGLMAPIIDFKKVRKRDKLTVEVPLLLKMSQFPTLLGSFNHGIVQNGATAAQLSKKPIGTGPFKLDSFTPGSQSTMSANADYFVHGGPYIEKLIINSSFTEDNATLNALLSGAIDAEMAMPYTLAQSVENNPGTKTLVTKEVSNFSGIQMLVNKGPLADKRVRQALRLLIDREAFVEDVALGFGEVTNDVVGTSCEFYDTSLVREQDLEQAKSLLKQAGAEDLRLTLQTGNAAPDFVPQATLFQQQAKAAGVSIELEKVDPAVYFTPSGGYLSRPFGQSTWYVIPALAYFWVGGLMTQSPYPETGWGTAARDKVILDALAEADPGKAGEKWAVAQKEQFDEGGYIVPNTRDFLDGLSTKVEGLKPSKAGNLGGYLLVNAWLNT